MLQLHQQLARHVIRLQTPCVCVDRSMATSATMPNYCSVRIALSQMPTKLLINTTSCVVKYADAVGGPQQLKREQMSYNDTKNDE